MITLRKHLAGPRSRYMLLPALLFLAGASLAAFGGGSAVAPRVLPAEVAVAAAIEPGGAGAEGQ